MVDLCFYCDGLSWENFRLLWFRKERVVVLEGSEFGMWAEKGAQKGEANYHNPIPSGPATPYYLLPMGGNIAPLATNL